MRRRSRVLVVVAGSALCAAVAGGLVVLHAAREGVVSRVNFLRVHAGMTEGEVERLFGEPGELIPATPGMLVVSVEMSRNSQPATSVSYPDSARVWKKGDHSYVVFFDSGKVVGTLGGGDPTTLERIAVRLRSWLR